MKRAAAVILSSLLLMVVVELAFHVQPVRAGADTAIYIRADGEVDPLSAPIQWNGDVYTLTGNITGVSNGIVVEKSNIIFDGNGCTLQGSGASYNENGFTLINVNNVTIKDTDIGGFYWGVYLNSTAQIALSGNRITNNQQDGIVAFASSNNTFIGNNVTNNGFCGVRLNDSSDNSVVGNNLTNNGSPGVWLNYSSANKIVGNFIAQNLWRGILLDYSSGNSIAENYITNNEYGILLHRSSANSVVGNNITGNTYGIRVHISSDNNNIVKNSLAGNVVYGVFLFYSSANIVSENSIAGNSIYGVRLDGSSGNSAVGNNITSNPYGVYVISSSGNFFYHNNFVNNTVQAYVTPGYENAWNSSYPSGGNCWSDYAGSDLNGGPYQNEAGSDGMGDAPYTINSSNVDNYPLMRRWVQFENQTICINDDGSVDPSGAPIQRRGDLYTLLDSLTSDGDGIVIDKDNVTLDGSGHTLRGRGVVDSKGIDLTNRTGVTVRNMSVEGFYYGVWVSNSSSSSVTGSNLSYNTIGLRLSGFYNNITGNTLVNNGVRVEDSNYTRIYHNSFINASVELGGANLNVIWDNGYEGNYWSSYNGTDPDRDGIGDTPYVIDGSNVDNYPLMSPYVYADVNHDGVVNMRDVGLVCRGVGSLNLRFDLNGDGLVNMIDVDVVCGNFGRRWGQ